MKTLKELVRPAIWNLKPYSSARDEYHGEATVFVDANENPYNAPYNRYPDPMQWQLKEKIALSKKIDPASILLGNGSDEPIDLMIRAFCTPGIDNIVAIDPTYGMYQVSADINDVEYRKVSLSTDFELSAEKLLQATDANTKLIFICSPNNPTGNDLNREEITKVLQGFDGMVIVDEAYIDFSHNASFTTVLNDHPNLVILQTFSKAWGSAGVRLGMAFASKEVTAILNKIKYPYNINQLTQAYASALLDREGEVNEWIQILLKERDRVAQLLNDLSLVKHIYPSDANFLLVQVEDANKIYQQLSEEGVIVRNRNNVSLCQGCLRITIGTCQENDIVFNALKNMQI
jgi:histidinol-phosphate aminotransferase